MANSESNKDELPLEGYKLLVGIIENEETLFWRRNEIFLAINTGLVIVLGLVLQSKIGLASFVVCIAAIIMCFPWFFIVIRGEAFYNHWFEQLKYLEKTYLSPQIRIFQNAEDFFAKNKITLGERENEIPLSFLAKHARIFRVMVLVPVIFLFAWTVLALYILF